jgi:hypothetical protein
MTRYKLKGCGGVLNEKLTFYCDELHEERLKMSVANQRVARSFLLGT